MPPPRLLTLDAIAAQPAEFALRAGDQRAVFRLRPFSVADEVFLTGLTKPFADPVDTLAVMLRQLETPEQAAAFCGFFSAAPPPAYDVKSLRAVAEKMAPDIPAVVLNGAAALLFDFRLRDREMLEGAVAKKRGAPRRQSLTLMLCGFASGLGGALIMFLACQSGIF